MKLTPTLLLLALAACHPAPAHADTNNLPAAPASPGGHPPANRAYQFGPGVAYDFDPGRGPLFDAHAEDDIWLDPYGAGWATTTPLQVLPPPVVAGCRPTGKQSLQVAVPGPIGLVGVAAAWGWARRLRRRVG